MVYYFNLETRKIELVFEKSAYNALTAQQKDSLHGAFLWKPSVKVWVSRAKEPNLYLAEKVATALGFTERQEVGTALSYEQEQVQLAERAQERLQRYTDQAFAAKKRADTLMQSFERHRGDIAFDTSNRFWEGVQKLQDARYET